MSRMGMILVDIVRRNGIRLLAFRYMLAQSMNGPDTFDGHDNGLVPEGTGFCHPPDDLIGLFLMGMSALACQAVHRLYDISKS